MRDVPPDNNVAHLQEELISLKLREAEGALSMKELSQRIEDMSLLWEKHLKENHQGENGKKKDYGKNIIAQLQDDLLSAKLGEAKSVATLKAANHRIMELESQVSVTWVKILVVLSGFISLKHLRKLLWFCLTESDLFKPTSSSRGRN